MMSKHRLVVKIYNFSIRVISAANISSIPKTSNIVHADLCHGGRKVAQEHFDGTSTLLIADKISIIEQEQNIFRIKHGKVHGRNVSTLIKDTPMNQMRHLSGK